MQKREKELGETRGRYSSCVAILVVGAMLCRLVDKFTTTFPRYFRARAIVSFSFDFPFLLV